eukprot:305603-Amphidinium_carterae.2
MCPSLFQGPGAHTSQSGAIRFEEQRLCQKDDGQKSFHWDAAPRRRSLTFLPFKPMRARARS